MLTAGQGGDMESKELLPSNHRPPPLGHGHCLGEPSTSMDPARSQQASASIS